MQSVVNPTGRANVGSSLSKDPTHQCCFCFRFASSSALTCISSPHPQVVRLCRAHRLHTALLDLFSRGLDDFVTPVVELMATERLGPLDTHTPSPSSSSASASTSAATTTAAADACRLKLLLYLRESFRGNWFPPGRGALPAHRVPILRAQLLALLLQPVPPTTPTPNPTTPPPPSLAQPDSLPPLVDLSPIAEPDTLTPTHTDTLSAVAALLPPTVPPPRTRLHALLVADPGATVAVLDELLREWDTTEADMLASLPGGRGAAAASTSEPDSGCDRVASQVYHPCAVNTPQHRHRAGQQLAPEDGSS